MKNEENLAKLLRTVEKRKKIEDYKWKIEKIFCQNVKLT
jgi:hypothetical protein